VEHKVDGGKYAVKKLKENGEHNAVTKVQEAERMCHLLHGNVCRYYNAWQESGVVHMRMELCDKNLPAWIRRRNNLLFGNCSEPPEPTDKILEDGWGWVLPDRAVNAGGARSSEQMWFKGVKAQGTNDFLKGLLKGLRYLHVECNLAHRDLHSGNVLLKFNTALRAVTAKICDFGQASVKISGSSNATDDDLKNVGKIM